MPRIEFVDYVHGVKTSLVSIVGVKHSGSNLHGQGVQNKYFRNDLTHRGQSAYSEDAGRNPARDSTKH
jgi:hypothetical protein